MTVLEKKEVYHGPGRPPTISRQWENYETVKTWSSGLEKSTYSPYYYLFSNFMDYLRASGTQFAGMTPDQLINFQLESTRRSQYEILKLVQTWAQSDRELRKSHIQNRVKALRSYFARNYAELPPDRSFRARSDTPPLPSGLKVEDIKVVLDHSNPTFRTVFLVMFQTFMDQDTMERWSDYGWKGLKPQLDKGADQVLIKIPGRKGSKNEDWFETRVGGDGLQFLRDYVKDIRGTEPGPVFYNQFGGRLQKKAIQTYWTRKLKDCRLVEVQPGKVVRYGKGIHQLRDVARSLWQMNAPDTYALAESMMGHGITGDQNNYVHLEDETWKHAKYANVLPYLNLLTSSKPYGLVKEDEVERLSREHGEELDALRREYRENDEKMADLTREINAKLEELSREFEGLKRRRSDESAES